MNNLLFSTSKLVHGHKTSNSFTGDDLDGPGLGESTSTVGFEEVGSGNKG